MGEGLGLLGLAISQRAQTIHSDILNNSGFLVLTYTTRGDLVYLREKGLIEDIEKIEFFKKYDAYLQENKRKGMVILDT